MDEKKITNTIETMLEQNEKLGRLKGDKEICININDCPKASCCFVICNSIVINICD